MTGTGARVLPLEINLVRFDNPKSVQPPIKQDTPDSGDTVRGIENLSCDSVLNVVVPPRHWERNGVIYGQKISCQPATKPDVKELGEKLDTYLRRFKASEVGICPIKQELYSQCFNEVIRQVTLNCTERGYMLIKIRDEINLTIYCYQELFESIIAHGIRKALLKEHKNANLEKRAEKLKAENVWLKAELAKTTAATAQLKRESEEACNAEMKHQTEKLKALKKTDQLFKARLESIIVMKKIV